MPPQLSPQQLKDIAQASRGRRGCEACTSLICPGWESLPAGFDERSLRLLGTLRDGPDEPGWNEYHPHGTRTDSPQAPVAPGYHPYNRCDVHACVGCQRAFLRYTEFGGYYVDHRIRELNPDLIVG